MSQEEKQQILETLEKLPEAAKQFVLGYAAGVVAKSSDQGKEKDCA
jgi:hypothetical protein